MGFLRRESFPPGAAIGTPDLLVDLDKPVRDRGVEVIDDSLDFFGQIANHTLVDHLHR
ncbi:hypothetical protein [uncultured Arthrobacter sp.]|uniref:hypothetical protein n=1 Tax=uncultured Arthrobacter sp. TaxID=114050 RepID=UPI0026128036|nr:hypothetical protein [uncultured Arthrobacter sp.]